MAKISLNRYFVCLFFAKLSKLLISTFLVFENNSTVLKNKKKKHFLLFLETHNFFCKLKILQFLVLINSSVLWCLLYTLQFNVWYKPQERALPYTIRSRDHVKTSSKCPRCSVGPTAGTYLPEEGRWSDLQY